MLLGPKLMHTIDTLEPRRLLAFAFDYASAFGDVETLDSGNAVVVDAAGNTYFGGTFRGKVDVNKSNHAQKFLNAVDNYDAFLVKYDPNGKLVWSRQIGISNGDETIEHLVIGPNGDLYATGQFEETVDFDAGSGVHPLTSHGKRDAFILHLTSKGKYVWAGNIGGERDDDITALAVGPSGDMYYSGFVRLSGDADPTRATRSIVDRGVDDTIIARLNGKNGAIKWLKVYGENATRETVFGLAVDDNENVTAAGMFNDPVEFDRGDRSFDREPVGSDDVYIARLNSRGNFQFIKTFGGKKQETVVDLVQDSAGNLYVNGNFAKTTDFDPGPGEKLLEAPGDSSAYILKLDADANFIWVRQVGAAVIGGSNEDAFIVARGLAVDGSGSVVTTGDFDGTVDFDPGSGERIIDVDKSNNTTAIAGQLSASDAYVLRLDADGNFVAVAHFGGEDGTVLAHDIAVDSSGGVNITGAYAAFVDLNPGHGNFRRSTDDHRNDTNIFLLKLLP
jgi:hypothetical protein